MGKHTQYIVYTIQMYIHTYEEIKLLYTRTHFPHLHEFFFSMCDCVNEHAH